MKTLGCPLHIMHANLHRIVDFDDGRQVEQFFGEQAGKRKN
jgi:hypothetical protein